MNTHHGTLLYPVFLFLLFILTSTANSQNGSITGKVMNAEEMVPISNVSIEITGRTNQVSTNEDGVFSIGNLSAGEYTLTLHLIGFKTFTTTLHVGEGELKVNFSLDPQASRMNEVVILGYRESYTAGDNYSASRINAPVMELPLSTGQVTGKLIDDQNILNVNDALRNISGVAVEFGGPAHPMVINIRGFAASVFKDGFRMAGTDPLSPGGGDIPVNISSVERIEVLKGPSAILYGRGEPGGVVNIISKKPSMKPEYSIEALSGSFQKYQLNGSATGPMFGQEFLSYRLDASYDRSKSYRDVVKTNSYFVKPSFNINASDNTQILLTGEFSNSKFTPDHGVLMLPYSLPDGSVKASLAPVSSRSYYFGDPNDNTKQDQQRGVIEIEHVVSPSWTLRASASYEKSRQLTGEVWDWYYTYQGATPPGFPEGLFPPNWTVRPIDAQDSKRADFGARFENVFSLHHPLFGEEIKHSILAVADLLQIDIRNTLDYSPSSILNPATGQRVQLDIPVFPHAEFFSNSKDYGLALQDLITIHERWHLLLGGRFEQNSIDATKLEAFIIVPSVTYSKSYGFAPRFGLLYQLLDNVSLFASYMGSYQSPAGDFGLWDIPASLKPERAYQTEVGTKIELFDKHALITTSVFLINKYDVITWKRNPSLGFPLYIYYNSGKENASGFDIDLVGEISTNLRITAAFNTQTMKFTNPYQITDGKRRYGTPAYSSNLWALYEFNSGTLDGVGIGGGITTRSSVWANNANEAELPSYITYDAVGYYEIADIRFQLNLYNISNTLYYSARNDGAFGEPVWPFTVMPSAPFNMTFSIRYQFQ